MSGECTLHRDDLIFLKNLDPPSELGFHLSEQRSIEAAFDLGERLVPQFRVSYNVTLHSIKDKTDIFT